MDVIANYIDQIVMFGGGLFCLYVANLMKEGRVGDKLEVGQRRMLANVLAVIGPVLMVGALLIGGLKFLSSGEI